MFYLRCVNNLAAAILFFLLVATLSDGSASAQTLEEAQLHFDRGRFLEAAQMRETLGSRYHQFGDAKRTAASLSLAAWAFAIHGKEHAPDEEKNTFYMHAKMLAERAREVDRMNSDAYFQLGFVLTLVSAGKPFTALMNRNSIREAFEKAIELNPSSIGAHIGLAAWHAVNIAICKAFPWLTPLLACGGRDIAVRHYETALRLAPKENGVHLEYAKGLLLLDSFDIRGRFQGCDNPHAVQAGIRARRHLVLAIQLAIETAYSQIQRDEAKKLLEGLDAHGCLVEHSPS